MSFLRHFIVMASAVFSLFPLSASGQSQSSVIRHPTPLPPKHEVRAVWLATIGGIDWPSAFASDEQSAQRQREQLCQILDQLNHANVNTVLLQTRVRSTLIYPSEIEPMDACLTGHVGRSPGYDPLAFAINECHKRGMELHAWVVTIPVGKWNSQSVKLLRKNHGALVKRIGDEAFMNPEVAGTADYLAKLCGEIVERYDVDGIHLDYIRYPETWNQRLDRNQGRKNITRIVSSVNREVKRRKPWVKLSCSPIGKYRDLPRANSRGWNAYTKVCQEAQAWLRDGLMDALFPMMYFRGSQFYPFAFDWQENAHGRIVAPGLAVWLLSKREGSNWPLTDITREMEVSRRLGLGHTYFRSRFFTENVKGLYDYAANRFDCYPALIPPMTWQHDVAPTPPTLLTMSGNTVSWSGAIDRSDGPNLTYNLYASNETPVDIDNPCNLLAARLPATSYELRGPVRQAYFAVTATDRYGNESKPLQSHGGVNSPRLLACNGTWLKLPEKASVDDADVVIVETLQGQLLATYAYGASQIDVSRLPQGMYVVRSLRKKGITHRLGHFIIMR